ncbi:Bul1 N terminus-domain-containing protein [Scheffersomyces xylosifermentans]|uniref:Bul1 N terminus-domain-containing protein n=1 Tax=Scheffersomyces xylosifermentans TaxID=1304137 RepID=UPI00315DAD62
MMSLHLQSALSSHKNVVHNRNPHQPRQSPSLLPPFANGNDILTKIASNASSLHLNALLPSYNCLIAPSISRRTSASSIPSSISTHGSSSPHEISYETYNAEVNEYQIDADTETFNAITHRRKESILDDISKYYDLTNTQNPVSDAIVISIQFDSECKEYQQDSMVTGYMSIRNNSEEAIPFDMFYVSFEGCSTVLETRYTKYKKRKRPAHQHKFLEMIDFASSYNPELFESQVFVDSGSALAPYKTYITKFSFKIPDHLLDSTCSHNSLSTHRQLPPSLGIPLGGMLSVNDHAYTDTSISYRVVARFVGPGESYGEIVGQDEYVTLKSAFNYVRVVGKSNVSPMGEKKSSSQQRYFDLMGSLKQKIEEGHELKRIQNREEQAPPEYEGDFVKSAKMMYAPVVPYIPELPTYEASLENHQLSVPISKKSFAGSGRTMGNINVYTPATEFVVNYITPKAFRHEEITSRDLDSWNLRIPITVDLTDFEKGSKPHIKSIRTELVMVTLRSDECAIPFEFDADMVLGKNKISTSDNDEDRSYKNIIEPMKSIAGQLYELCKEVGTESLKVEKSLAIDLRSICKLKEKCTIVTVNDVKVDTGKGIFSSTSSRVHNWHSKCEGTTKFNLMVNLAATSEIKRSRTGGFDEHCLLPTFQSCHFARLYYVRIRLEFSHNETCVYIKVPVVVAKDRGYI